MRKRVVAAKQNFILKYLLSYFAIMVISLMFSWELYGYTAGLLKKNAEKNSLQALEQTKEVMTGHIREAELYLNQLANDPEILQFMYLNNKSKTEEIEMLWNLLREFSRISFADITIDGIYVWFRKDDYILTQNGRYTTREYYENRYADTEKSYEDWMRQLIQKSPYLGYFRSCTMIEEGVPRKMMDFSWSVPMGFSSDTLGSVHVLIGQEKASELLKTAYGQNHGYAYIATSDGKLVASSGMEEELWMVDLRSQESEGVEHREVRGVNSIISYTRSPRNGWQYVSVQPISDVLRDVQGLRNVFFLLFLLCMTVTTVFILFFSAWVTLPIRSMLRRLREYQNENSTVRREDPLNIETAVDRLIHENQYIRQEIEIYEPVMKNVFVTKLIRGKFSDMEEIISGMEQTGTAFSGQRYAVLLLYISGYREKVSREILKESNAMKAVIRSVCSVDPLLGGALEADIDDNCIAMIAAFHETEEAACIEQLEEAVRNVSDTFGEFGNVAPVFFYGGITDSLVYIDQSYMDAKRKMERYILSGEAEGMENIEEGRANDFHYFYPMEIEYRLLHLCREGKLQEIRELLEKIQRKNFMETCLDYESMRLLLEEVKGTIYKASEQAMLEEERQKQIVDELSRMGHWDFIRILELFQSICSQVEEKRYGRESKLKREIEAYLKESYTDVNLCLQALAEHFSLNESYLSVFIKESFKETFTAYVQRLRLSKACELLRGSALTIDEVAEAVGYSSAPVFRRAFKRQYGIPPAVYRENMQE